ncbi:MAG: response regulator [Caulobacterales bacterium]|nr:response regulator [Caulobacterales bacterium]
MKPVVLFVDDDLNILRGLRRMLRGRRDRWEMLFAEGGQAAIDMLEERAVDAVVSDMRMPGVDGASVMEHAQRRAPHAVRVVLSGESDRALTLRTVGLSHRFFAKPCDTSALIAAVERPLAVKAALAPLLDGTADGDLMRLWTPADVGARFFDTVRRPGATPKDVAEVARQDPALAARLLQLANSAYFGPAASLCRVEEAAERLGMETLRDVLDADRLTAFGPSQHQAGALHPGPRPRALADAAHAKAVEDGGEGDLADAADCVGLLYRLGARTDLPCAQDGAASHVANAAYLATLMGLPDRVCEALRQLAEGDPITSAADGAGRIVERLAAPLGRAA